jgi:hypothetical protein
MPKRKDLLVITSLFLIIGWIYLNLATYNTYRFFEPELLGKVFDAQAESFMAGRIDVDRSKVGWEYFVVDGKTQIYWGPWPAFLRIPLLLAWPQTFGLWARLSCFVAALLAVLGWAAAVFHQLGRRHLGLAFVVVLAIALGTPMVWLLSTSAVYHEAILWGIAGSAWCLLGALKLEARPSRVAAASFAMAFFVAYLSRSTYAFPWLIVAGRFVYRIVKDGRLNAVTRRQALAILLVPIAVAVSFYAVLNYGRFGNPFSFMDLKKYHLIEWRPGFLEQYGFLNLIRLPDEFKAYYVPHHANFSFHFPFVRTARIKASKPEALFLIPDFTIALTVTSPWLFVFFLHGLWRLRRSRRPSEWIVPASLFIQAAVSLILSGIVMRYLVEALPFFIAMVIWSLKDEDGLPDRFRRSLGFRVVLVSLCVCSMYTSIASAIAWTAERNEGSPVEYRENMKRRFDEVDQRLRSYVRMMR